MPEKSTDQPDPGIPGPDPGIPAPDLGPPTIVGPSNPEADPPPLGSLSSDGRDPSSEEGQEHGGERTNEAEWNWRNTNEQSDESNSEGANQSSDERSDTPEDYQSCEDRLSDTQSEQESDVEPSENAEQSGDVTGDVDDNQEPVARPCSGAAAASDTGPDHRPEPTTLWHRYPRRKRKQPPYLGWYHNPYITKHGRIGVLDFWPYFMVASWPPTILSW